MFRHSKIRHVRDLLRGRASFAFMVEGIKIKV